MVTDRLPRLNVTGTIVPGTTSIPLCWTPTVTAMKVVAVELQSFENVRTIECPATGIVTMSRVVELYVSPSATSVGEVQIVCNFGDKVVEADANALVPTPHPNIITKT